MKSKTKSQCDYGNHITGECIGGHLRIGNHSDYYDYSDDVMLCHALHVMRKNGLKNIEPNTLMMVLITGRKERKLIQKSIHHLLLMKLKLIRVL
ncbi:TPA: hypothetical protein ACT3Y6_001643 [Proteus mirabilis]|uniref:hypothetical protein n=1 Tax=Proteus mirabilis TaxID=584 RepID=UPI0006671BFA|nr:hypothetical protein [Proteus mirabilis]ARA23492.1 hypothetical protein AM438_13755 [Proteus mirabilis]EKV0741316.1 hypothetical protein [Proteus mirabilis]MBG5966165.1 hypothetical protein [Proteus mirabilis]HAT4483484.1 hypothetical protein [Proteus mirabilis]HAU5760691.1 hypothetical protein [Proteus mirabilis]